MNKGKDKGGGWSTQVHYVLCRRGKLRDIRDCKFVEEESVARQHQMVDDCCDEKEENSKTREDQNDES